MFPPSWAPKARNERTSQGSCLVLLVIVLSCWATRSGAGPVCDPRALFHPPVTYATGAGPTDVAVGDFNSDGVFDAALVNQTGASVTVLLGKNGGTAGHAFEPGATYPLLATPQRVAVGDFNNDGILDLVITSPGAGFFILLGQGSGGAGDGTFAPAALHRRDESTFIPWGVVTGDFDRDGMLDLAITNNYIGGAGRYVQIRVFRGRGDGTFLNYGRLGGAGATFATAITSGDLNGDGVTDLAACGAFGNTNNHVMVNFGLPCGGPANGSFTSTLKLPEERSPLGLAAGDFNGDGTLDLATANDFNTVSVLFNRLSGGCIGGFSGSPVSYGVENHPTDLTAADFNHDGILDLVVCGSGYMEILIGLDGTFTRGPIFGQAEYNVRVISADLNRDGLPDLLVVNNRGNNVAVFMGRCVFNRAPDCSGATAVIEPGPPNHRLVPVAIAGVVDGDGDPVSIRVTAVTQDEPVLGGGTGNSCPDAAIDPQGNASVRRERSGGGNGRVYALTFVAEDGRGGQCEGRVTVCVPHGEGRGGACVDDGQTENSLQTCRFRVELEDVSKSFALRIAATPSGAPLLEYGLPEAAKVELAIYDVVGRRVSILIAGHEVEGVHRVPWNAAQLPRGVYFARLRAGARQSTVTLLNR